MRSIYIDFYDDNFHAILAETWEKNNGFRLPARIITSDGITLDSVAIRYRGNSTFSIANNAGLSKVPLNIDLDEYIKQDYHGYTKLKLANGLFDPSLRREAVANGIYRDYIPTSELNHVKVYIQGVYVGLYINLESVNKDFVKKHYGFDQNAIFKCDPIQQFGVDTGATGDSNLAWLGPDTTSYYNHYQIKSDDGWGSFVNMLDILNNNTPSVDDVLNMDQILWAFALNTALANFDTYNGFFAHNYYMYEDFEGIYQMLPWDLSESFIGAFFAFSGRSALINYDPHNGARSRFFPLVRKINQNPFYKKLYTAHIRTILSQSMNEDSITQHLQNLESVIKNAALQDVQKIYSNNDFTNNVERDIFGFAVPSIAGILNTFRDRLAFLNNHAEIIKTPPTLSNPIIELINQEYIVSIQSTLADQVQLHLTTNIRSSKFEVFVMSDDGVAPDVLANDGIYAITLPEQNEAVKYYFLAENDDAIMLEPETAKVDYYLFNPNKEQANLVLNELMASNTNTIADDFGEFDDWIEIYNKGNLDVGLSNLYLSDDASNLKKWALIDTALNADNYLIVWADSDSKQGKTHANFKLSSMGESVYLSDIEGNILDSTTFGLQETDISYGRLPNGTGPFEQLFPTPGSINQKLTSIDLKGIRSNITAFPNPADNYIQIVNTNENLSRAIVELYNIQGIKINQYKLNKSLHVNTDYLGAGSYFFRILFEEGSAVIKFQIE